MNRFQLLVPGLLCAVVAVSSPVRAQEFLGKRLEKWQADLTDKDEKVRRGAAFALGKFPDSANRVIPSLLKRLKEDKDPGVRDAAATALGDVLTAAGSKTAKANLKVYWADAEPVLRQALAGERDEQALRGVLYAIGSFGSQAAPLLNRVLDKLQDKEPPSTRQNAAWAVGRIVAEKWDESERPQDWARRLEENADKAVPVLSKRLKDDDPLVRRDAATALGDVGAQALEAAQTAPNPVLDKLGEQAGHALLELVQDEKKDDVVKKTALEKLIKLIPPKKKDKDASPYQYAAKSLCDLLNNEDPELAHLAAFVLAKIGGEEADPAVAVLGKALYDEEPDTQRRAAASLEILGPRAAPAVSDLCQVLRNKDSDETTRVYCANALGRLGAAAKPAVPDLIAVLKSKASLKLRHFAAEALHNMRLSSDDPAMADLLEVLAKPPPENEDPNQEYTTTTIRQRCLWCFLGRPKEDLKDAIPTLTAILDEKGNDGLMVRYDAARILAVALREEAPDKAADWLLHMLRNDKLNIYFGTNANVSGGGTEASSGDAKLTANTGGDARCIAAEALGWMGNKAANRKDIVEELKKAAAEGKDARLREESRKALLRLRAS